MIRILISAAEASSDTHGAELLKAIRGLLPKDTQVDAFGVGGPKLQAAGLRTIVDARQLLAMGFVEVLRRLPQVFRALTKIVRQSEETLPDVAVVIDYPDFHFLLGKKLKKIGIPVVYYIPPKIWVWRKKRARVLRDVFDKLLCIFPFEREFYQQLHIDAQYVGNPLLDELPMSLTKLEARQRLDLKAADRVLVLMPGSRPSELAQHLDIMCQAAYTAAVEFKKSGLLPPGEKLKVLLPFPLTAELRGLEEKIQAATQNPTTREAVEFRVSQGDAPVCLVAADAGLIKSGTSTLEAALLRCPHAVLYKPGATTTWIFKNLIRYKGPVALVNLVARSGADDATYLVPEILCENVTHPALVSEIVSLMSSAEKRSRQLQGFDGLIEKMGGDRAGASPSALAAREVLAVALQHLHPLEKDKRELLAQVVAQ